MRAGWAIAGLLSAAALAASASAAPADPAIQALQRDDAYVSPRVLGSAAAAGEAVLEQSAAALRDAGRPVKLAVVIGPAGAPSLRRYAMRIASATGHEGTVVVTMPGGRTVAVAPGADTVLWERLARGRVSRIPNPVERAARAAHIAAVPVESDAAPPTEATVVLLCLALLGGGWAAAVGAGRRGRGQRRQLTEARAALRVYLDAVRSHAVALARRPGLDDASRQRVESALGCYAEVVAALQETADVSQVRALAPKVETALATLAKVAADVGERMPADDPFAGLCAADPAHGVATGEGRLAGEPMRVRLCSACRDASESGAPPARRALPRDGRPLPFDEAEPPWAVQVERTA